MISRPHILALPALITLVAITFSASMAFAWNGPTQTAPSGNTATPINVSGTSQVKAGSFWADTVGSTVGFCIGASCITSWPASQWTIVGTVIHYPSGKVGIGTASPIATLDINGVMRLAPQSAAPAACSASLKGSVALTGNARLCVCNGTSWVFDYNGAACSWPSADTTAPTVAITAPANGATVSGTVSVTATASDNIAVVGVQFKLDGVNLSTEDTTSPYSISWNTTTATNGSHTLTAVARDAGGNTTTSSVVTVTVSNVVAGSQTYSTPGTYSFTVPSHNTLVVEVWGGGGGAKELPAGGNGGQSSWNSAVIAGGGQGAPSISGGAGGTASGGDINTSGSPGSGQNGGASPNGGAGGINPSPKPGVAPGGGGAGEGGGGGGGAYSKKTYSAGAIGVGTNISVVVGAGGAPATPAVGSGASGRVYITWN